MINFDSPSRETCTVRETRTNTPLQALDLMNDVTFVEASRKLAERILREGGTDPGKRIDYLYWLVLARPVEPAERQIVLETLRRFESRYRTGRGDAKRFLRQGDSPVGKLDARELAAYTAVASLILNLDETITRE
jgi:hypothetical protein